MTKKTRFARLGALAVGALFLVSILGGCAPAWVPVSDGKCGHGRVWVPPSKDAQGNLKEGYCKDADR